MGAYRHGSCRHLRFGRCCGRPDAAAKCSRADEITSALQSEQLEACAGIEPAYTATTKALVAVIAKLNNEIQTSGGRWRSVLASTQG